MAQTAFTVRMDADIKKQFDELCAGFGMSTNTAFNVFARAVVYQKRIPFDIESGKAAEERENAKRLGDLLMEMRADVQRRGVPELSLEEINALIKETREQMKKEGKR